MALHYHFPPPLNFSFNDIIIHHITYLMYTCFLPSSPPAVWVSVVNSTSGELTHLNSSLERLQSDLDVLQANLTAVRDRVNRTFQNPNCVGCSEKQSELELLSLDTTIHVSERL